MLSAYLLKRGRSSPLIPTIRNKQPNQILQNCNNTKLTRVNLSINEKKIESLLPSAKLNLEFYRSYSAKVKRKFPKPKNIVWVRRQEEKRIERVNQKRNRPLQVPANINAKGIASLLAVRTIDVLKEMIKMGVVPATSEEYLEQDVVDMTVLAFGRIPSRDESNKFDRHPRPEATEDEKINFPFRPAVISIMGHIDHGKTTLLDAIRQGNVAKSEYGGITQKIGAFSVDLPTGSITFIDTPGHEAFSKQRKRGANLTDIAVLVVAADDGVQEQTIECIKQIQQAGASMIVALNKCDKKNIDKDKVKLQLNTYGVPLEDFGGDVPLVEISALNGEGLDKLIDVLLMQATILELRADESGQAEASILDCRREGHYGDLASVIVRVGTLKKGDAFVAGTTYGKVKTLITAKGKQIKEATPGMAVDVQGWEAMPSPGDELMVVDNEAHAKAVAGHRAQRIADRRNDKAYVQKQQEELAELQRQQEDRLRAVELGEDEEAFAAAQQRLRQASRAKEIPIVIKADVGGSIEAIKDA